MAKPLYEATKGGEWELLIWEKEEERAFQTIKQTLTDALALGLPDPSKPFSLYVHEWSESAVGVLTQMSGSWQHLVAYVSKQALCLGDGLRASRSQLP